MEAWSRKRSIPKTVMVRTIAIRESARTGLVQQRLWQAERQATMRY
jgi:hypothetical protein